MARCMRANGVPNFPDPIVGTGSGGHGVRLGFRVGPGVDPQSPAFQSAQQKCHSMLPAPPGGAGVKGPG